MVDFKPLTIRKVADKTVGHRAFVFDPEQGRSILINPESGQPENWPLAGIRIEGEIPEYMMLSTNFVRQGKDEGWIEVENERPIHRPGGPEGDHWRVTHTFMHVDAVILKTLDGDYRYEVFGPRGQPDKYDTDNQPVDSSGDPSHEVEWYYDLKLVSSP